MGEERLTIRADAQGTDKTSQDLKKVADARKDVVGVTKGEAEATKQSAEAQDKLNASMSDFTGLLTQINPALGQLADGFFKGFKIAGDFATREIDLTAILKKASEAIKGNVDALKLIGAGGAVVAAIYAITAALHAMQEEAARVRKEIRGIIDAQTELQGQRAEIGQSIENARDASGQGGFTAKQARAATDTARDIQGKAEFGFLNQAAIVQAIAAVGGRSDQAGGGNRSIDDIAKIAFLIQSGKLSIPPGASGGAVNRTIDSALGRSSKDIASAFSREREQARDTVGQAIRELSASGGSVFDLEQLAKKRTAGTASDPHVVAIIAQAVEEVVAKITSEQFIGGSEASRERFGKDISTDYLRQRLATLGAHGGFPLTGDQFTERDVQFARQLVTEVRSSFDRLSNTAPTTVEVHNHHNQFARQIITDKASTKKRAKYGEKLIRQRSER